MVGVSTDQNQGEVRKIEMRPFCIMTVLCTIKQTIKKAAGRRG
jgi:hypothetical protein